MDCTIWVREEGGKMTLLELIFIALAQIVGLFILFAVGYFLLVLIGLANSYGEHDQLMNWFKKIFKKERKNEERD